MTRLVVALGRFAAAHPPLRAEGSHDRHSGLRFTALGAACSLSPSAPALGPGIASLFNPRIVPAGFGITTAERPIGGEFPLDVFLPEDNADNQKLALRCLERRPSDLILIALEMPEMDGLEASRQIRAASPSNIREISAAVRHPVDPAGPVPTAPHLTGRGSAPTPPTSTLAHDAPPRPHSSPPRPPVKPPSSAAGSSTAGAAPRRTGACSSALPSVGPPARSRSSATSAPSPGASSRISSPSPALSSAISASCFAPIGSSTTASASNNRGELNAVLIFAVALPTFGCKAHDSALALLVFVTGLLLGLSPVTLVGFPGVPGLTLTVGFRFPAPQFPLLVLLCADSGFLFQGQTLRLKLALGCIPAVSPRLLSSLFRRELVVTCRAQAQPSNAAPLLPAANPYLSHFPE